MREALVRPADRTNAYDRAGELLTLSDTAQALADRLLDTVNQEQLR